MRGSIYDRRFVIVAGKGGVGKSTVCAALAMAAARRGKRVLIVELANKGRAHLLFEHPTEVGYEPVELHPGIDCINVTTEPALEEYGLMKLRWKRLYKVVFENPMMRTLVRMLPGMKELLLIGKAWYLEQERDDRTGKPRWDMLIVDAPATGHGALVFQIPHVIMETVKAGPMLDETRRIQQMLMDRTRTCLNIVTLPEEMPVNEALELESMTKEKLQIGLGYLFVNSIWPETPSDNELEILRAYRNVASGRDERFDNVLQTLRFMVRRRNAQLGHLTRVQSHSSLPAVQLPYLIKDHFGLEALEALSHQLDAGVERHESASA
jgi:anion-transporting  ArsA/GET3 family ATPase